MQIKTPMGNTTFTISADAVWPAMIFTTDGSGPHTWNWSISWRKFKKSGTATTPGNTWDASAAVENLGGALVVSAMSGNWGGVAKTAAAASFNVGKPGAAAALGTALAGKAPPVTVKIIGAQPAVASVVGYVNRSPGGTGFDKILQHESSCRHFTPAGEPIQSFDAGYGVSQLTSPAPSYEEVWNWKLNVDAGLRLFAAKRNGAITYLSQSKRTYTNDQLTREAVCRWNGGSYHEWDGKAWVRPANILCDSKDGQHRLEPQRQGKRGEDRGGTAQARRGQVLGRAGGRRALGVPRRLLRGRDPRDVGGRIRGVRLRLRTRRGDARFGCWVSSFGFFPGFGFRVLRFAEQRLPRRRVDFDAVSAVAVTDFERAAVDLRQDVRPQHVRRRAQGGDAALVEQQDLRGFRRQFFEVVGDHHDRGRGRAGAVHHVDGGQDLFAGEQVEAVGGFVEQQKFRFDRQRAGDEAAHAFAAAHGGVGVGRDVGEADEGEEAVGVGFHLGGDGVVEADAAEEARQHDLACGEAWLDVVRAGGLDEADVAAGFEEVGLAERAAEDRDFAAGGPEVAGEDSGERALAAAVGAEDRDARAGGDLPGDVLQDGGFAADEGDVFQIDGVGHWSFVIGPLQNASDRRILQRANDS